jgi:DNA-binding NarL/FixJ family response regulator
VSTTVVLADDEPLVRRALAQMLTDARFDLLGQASTGDQAIELVVERRPDIVLMDISVDGGSGVETIEQLTLLAPSTRVLILTRSDQNRVVDAIIAGACGYILKTACPEAIVSAARATAAGDCVLSPQIAGKLVEHIRERATTAPTGTDADANVIRATLTAREYEIFKLLASGDSNQQIGKQLSLSAHTVSNHIKSILGKLQLDNRIQAAVRATRSGIA